MDYLLLWRIFSPLVLLKQFRLLSRRPRVGRFHRAICNGLQVVSAALNKTIQIRLYAY